MDIRVNSQTAIVFDLDDTLYNEIEFLKSAYIELSKKLEPVSWKVLYTNLFSRYRNQENVFDYVSERYEISKNELLETYRNHHPDIEPFDGVIELLKAIKNNEGKIGIITDGRAIAQRNKIKALGLMGFVDYLVISEEIGSEKPSEKNFKAIETNLECKTNYYIADNFKKDFVSPNQLGWNTIALLDNGLNIHSNAFRHQDKAHLPTNFISSIKELNVVQP